MGKKKRERDRHPDPASRSHRLPDTAILYRRLAAFQFSSSGNGALDAAIRRLLSSPSPEVAASVLVGLSCEVEDPSFDASPHATASPRELAGFVSWQRTERARRESANEALAAVCSLIDVLQDVRMVRDLAAKARSRAVREQALAVLSERLRQIGETAALEYARGDRDLAVRLCAVRALGPAALAVLAVQCEHPDVAEEAASRVEDPAALRDVACRAKTARARASAAARVDDEVRIALATGDPDASVRAAAIACLSDPATLARIAIEESDTEAARRAARRLEDVPALIDVARSARDYLARCEALAQLGVLKWRDDAARAALGALAAGDPDERIRKNAAHYLGPA